MGVRFERDVLNEAARLAESQNKVSPPVVARLIRGPHEQDTVYWNVVDLVENAKLLMATAAALSTTFHLTNVQTISGRGIGTINRPP